MFFFINSLPILVLIHIIGQYDDIQITRLLTECDWRIYVQTSDEAMKFDSVSNVFVGEIYLNMLSVYLSSFVSKGGYWSGVLSQTHLD